MTAIRNKNMYTYISFILFAGKKLFFSPYPHRKGDIGINLIFEFAGEYQIGME